MRKVARIGTITLFVIALGAVVAAGPAAATNETTDNRTMLSSYEWGDAWQGASHVGEIEISDSMDGADPSFYGLTESAHKMTVTFEYNGLTRTETVMLVEKDPSIDYYKGAVNLTDTYDYLGVDPVTGVEWDYPLDLTIQSVSSPSADLNTTFFNSDAYTNTKSGSNANFVVEPMGTRSGDVEINLKNHQGGGMVGDYNATIVSIDESTTTDVLTAETLNAQNDTTLFPGEQDISKQKLWLWYENDYEFEVYETNRVEFYEVSDSGRAANSTDDDPIFGGGSGGGGSNTMIYIVAGAAALLLLSLD